MSQAKRGRLLIVDDESELLDALCETLAEENYVTVGASNAAAALEALAKQDFDILLTDLMMPGMDGIQLLRKALELDPNLVGIIMTGQGTISTAVEAMKVGAFDYVLKPFNLQTMLPILARSMEVRRLRTENIRLRRHVERLQYESPRYQMIGSGPAMQRVLQLIAKVAPSDATVLIRGASGTGKELVARALHFNSPRRDRPLVTVNCAALQETLVESELFGHEKGAFTGAQQAKPGLIEVAEGGTLFIDEVAEMPPPMQAKLLRVLEDGHYRRVGSTKECHADVRVIAATNKNLEEEQKAGRFREDLFYRLNVVTIDLPPLRERAEDIPALVEHFLTTRQIGSVRCRVDPQAMEALVRYSWPGNVRELANVIERAQILAENNVITLDDLPETLHQHTPPPRSENVDPLNLRQLERRAVVTALERAKGNKVQAARALGISRRALYRLLAKYGLDHRADDAAPVA
ncbi:MAG: sigma-54 dependent transcriptional regulator [Gemmataceae bacterium]|nr:sigma-54 dependent transcriptional regulator [Gemmataceae bacterium]MDW8267514.1 sigma-54 dependent transcriptional regulator [Gemmataceae bacterium]